MWGRAQSLLRSQRTAQLRNLNRNQTLTLRQGQRQHNSHPYHQQQHQARRISTTAPLLGRKDGHTQRFTRKARKTQVRKRREKWQAHQARKTKHTAPHLRENKRDRRREREIRRALGSGSGRGGGAGGMTREQALIVTGQGGKDLLLAEKEKAKESRALVPGTLEAALAKPSKYDDDNIDPELAQILDMLDNPTMAVAADVELPDELDPEAALERRLAHTEQLREMDTDAMIVRMHRNPKLATTRRFNDLIHAQALQQQHEAAFRSYHRMLELGVQPNEHTYFAVMQNCALSGEPDVAKTVRTRVWGWH